MSQCVTARTVTGRNIGVGFLFILQLRLCRLVLVDSVFLDQHHASGAINHFTTAGRYPLGCSRHTHGSRNANSRATIAPCAIAPPTSITSPDALRNRDVQPGSVEGATRISPTSQAGCVRVKDHPRGRRYAPSRGTSPSQRPFRLSGTLGNLSPTCWISTI